MSDVRSCIHIKKTQAVQPSPVSRARMYCRHGEHFITSSNHIQGTSIRHVSAYLQQLLTHV